MGVAIAEGTPCAYGVRRATANLGGPPYQSAATAPDARSDEDKKSPRRDRTHWLYIAVIIAVILGIITGFVLGEDAAQLQVLGDAFVNLIKMMIGPIIF